MDLTKTEKDQLVKDVHSIADDIGCVLYAIFGALCIIALILVIALVLWTLEV